jgi:hypothetical protein
MLAAGALGDLFFVRGAAARTATPARKIIVFIMPS